MSPESRNVSERRLEEELGSLRACLVEGDAEQRQGERRVRRRALTISILLQSAVLATLILVPLFARTERIALGRGYVPMPPYGHHTPPQRGNARPSSGKATNTGLQFTFNSPNSKPRLHPDGETRPLGLPEDPIGNQPNGPYCDACIDIGGKTIGPRAPDIATGSRATPTIIHQTHLDPGMLLRRVEPVYPALAMQIHREGRVELHAIIGTDGSIQSLQVVTGDPLFLPSAMQAVQQWHYRPTILNGQAVEVDTYITVLYVMQH
jgi:protein TonB